MSKAKSARAAAKSPAKKRLRRRASPVSSAQGVLPDRELRHFVKSGAIFAEGGLLVDQVQPASLDLRLGKVAFRLRASFLPGAKNVADRLDDSLVMHTLDLTRGAVLETGCVYLVPLQETPEAAARTCPPPQIPRARPAASTCSSAPSPIARARSMAFPPAITANSMQRFPRARSPSWPAPATGCCSSACAAARRQPVRDMTFSLDLHPTTPTSSAIAPSATRRVIDLAGIGAHTVEDFWEPVRAREGRIVLDPGEFYILASKEKIVIPLDEAAEMAPIAPELGEFRAHYAGFFDPGFGVTHTTRQGRARSPLARRALHSRRRPARRPPGVRETHAARPTCPTAPKARTRPIRARACACRSISRLRASRQSGIG